MITDLFQNEKRMQNMFGLRHRPDRYSKLETAEYALKHYTKMQHILVVNENPLGIIPGFYIVCPADAARIIRFTDGAINYVCCR